MNLVGRLLEKNISAGRIAAFVVSNLVGLTIVVAAIQFYEDAGSLWRSEDSFLSSDYLVINKRVGSSGVWGDAPKGFSEEEVSDIRKQPWVREVGEFTSSDYKVVASAGEEMGGGMSTMLFFESVPDEFIDVLPSGWKYVEGDDIVPIMISKDYLALYNFGFAGSAGLPQLSENLLSTIPLRLELIPHEGIRKSMIGKIVGFSNRMNTILVPEGFMKWSNRNFGGDGVVRPERLIVNVNSPGDVEIKEYLDSHDFEIGGDKSGSSASFMLNLIVGMIVAIGIIISLLSFLILLLSVSLIMEKNRGKIHSLLMLGVPLERVSAPYIRIVVLSSAAALLLALCGGLCMRLWYLKPLKMLGVEGGDVMIAPCVAVFICVVLTALNILHIRKVVKNSWIIA